MFFRENILVGEVERLVDKLMGVKEVVYYALCRPDEFRVWVNAALNIKEQKELLSISTQLGNVLFTDEVIGCGVDVNESRTELFYVESAIKKEMAEYRGLLDQLPLTDTRVLNHKQRLIYAAANLDALLLAHTKLVDDHAKMGWQGLALDVQYSFRCLLLQMPDIILSQDEAMIQLSACGVADSLLSKLRSNQLWLKRKITELFETQISSEQRALNLSYLYNMQDAVTKVMDDNEGEQKEGKDWFVTLLRRHHAYKQQLASVMPSLALFQEKFTSYLKSKGQSDNAERKREDNRMKAFKDYAKLSYGMRTAREMLKANSERIQEKQNIEDTFRDACAFYEEENFKPALLGFLSGARGMHPASCFNVGNMLMKGEGCDRDPLMARYYFWLAYGLEDVDINGLPYHSAAIQADIELAEFTEQVTPENEEMNRTIDATALDQDVLMKSIFKSQKGVMGRLFRLGELLITILSVRSDKSDSNEDILKVALYFFRWSYQYAYDAYHRKNIITGPLREDGKCKKRHENLNKLTVNIIWHLDGVCKNRQLENLHPLVYAFYERYPLKAEPALTAPALR